jgi:hypothetical protein
MRIFVVVSGVIAIGLGGLTACNNASEDAAPVVAEPAKTAAATADAPVEDGSPVGVAECDEYLKLISECLEKLPPEARGAMEQGIKQSREAWKQAVAAGAKDSLQPGCKVALDALKKNPACQ